MKTNLKVAIYLDHYRADVFEYLEHAELIQTIESEFNAVEKKKVLLKGESHMHHKEQDLQKKFYETLKKKLVKYNSILLFGTTTAKTELFHVLQADHTFATKEIILKNTDRFTENQKAAFINDFFKSL
jgi:hypothetical protein